MTHTSQSERTIPMNFDNITIGQAKQIAELVNGIKNEPTCMPADSSNVSS